MQRLWPPGTPSLPLEGTISDDGSDEYYVEFRGKKYGEVVACIKDTRGYVIDMIVGHSFLAAYEIVVLQYPGAHWENPDE